MQPARPRASQVKGFTLTELMVTLTVLSVVLAVGIPSFKNLLARNRVSGQANEFIGALNLARSEAVRRGQPVTLRSAAGTEDFGTGWEIFPDADTDGTKASPATDADGSVIRVSAASAQRVWIERVLRSGTAPAFVYSPADSSTSGRMYLTFTSVGGNQVGNAIFFRVCDKSDSSVTGRLMEVSTTGRISVVDPDVACPSS
ncbi:MAG: GspH/FimT family pseudopilin [Pseudomonadota bacterium]